MPDGHRVVSSIGARYKMQTLRPHKDLLDRFGIEYRLISSLSNISLWYFE